MAKTPSVAAAAKQLAEMAEDLRIQTADIEARLTALEKKKKEAGQ